MMKGLMKYMFLFILFMVPHWATWSFLGLELPGGKFASVLWGAGLGLCAGGFVMFSARWRKDIQ